MKNYLLTCIDARNKYLNGLGDLNKFDEIIDITELVKEREYYKLRPTFQDRLEKAIFVDNEYEFIKKFKELPTNSRYYIFAPQTKYEKLFYIIPYLKSKKGEVNFILNRHTLKRVKYRTPQRLIKNWLVNRVEIDTIYLSHKLAYSGWDHYVKPLDIKFIKHMDAPRMAHKKNNIGVFCDSCFPFHAEFKYKRGFLDPKLFYKQLEMFLIIKKKTLKLDNVIIAQHPNSTQEELKYIKSLDTVYGKTQELLSQAKYCWSFASDSAGMAIAYGVNTENVIFQNILPTKTQNGILRKSKSLGIKLTGYDGKKIKTLYNPGIYGNYINSIYKRYYNSNGPYFTDLI